MFRYRIGPDPFDFRPRHHGAGQAGRTFSPARLATFFGLPGLTRDLYPMSPWPGADRARAAPPRPDGGSVPGEFAERFRASVRRAAGEHEHVAVAASGGMDSLALLDAVARVCRADGRRLVVVVLDLVDDTGLRTRSLVERQLAFLRVDAEPVAVDPRPSKWPEPRWDAFGPRFDAWPRLHMGIVAAAEERGATVLIHGNGADQLLQVPPYLGAEFARRGRWRAGRRYLADCASRGELSELSEVLAAAGRITGPARARLYWSAAWPGFTEDRGSPVLTGEMAATVRDWLAGFQQQSLLATRAARATWAEAWVMHRLFPFDLPPDAGGIPEVAPYLDREFARYAYHLPLTARYVPELPSAYLRGKGLIAGMLPEGVDSVLAPRRQRFYKAYRRYWQLVATEPDHCVELGILRPDWRRRCRDAFDLAMVTACESWIRGALERGAVPSGEPAARALAG